MGTDDTTDMGTGLGSTPLVIQAPPRAAVPVKEPIITDVAHGETLTGVWFGDRGVYTVDGVGYEKPWVSPTHHAFPDLCLGKGRGVPAQVVDHRRSKQGLGELLFPAAQGS